RCNSPDAKFSCRITQFHPCVRRRSLRPPPLPASPAAPCVRRRSLLPPPPRRTLPKRLEV
ncbi:hypothetical protein HN51_069711, partial [Arachis hypogaea]